MKRALAVAAVVAAGLALSGARPGDLFTLSQQLNGQPVRFVQADAGRSGVYSSGSTGCMPLFDAGQIIGGSLKAFSPNVLLFIPKVPGNLCLRPSSFSTSWDGGCNHIPSDENYGVPLPAFVPQYLTPDVRATHLCYVTDAGAMAEAVWTVQ